MQRCRQTASAVAPDLPPQVDADLREIDFGQWETRTFAEAAGDDPSLVDRWARFEPGFRLPGRGKRGRLSVSRSQLRPSAWSHAEAQTVLAVTHGGVIRTMICHLLGLEPRHYVAFDVPYAALAVIDLFDGKGVLAALERPERRRTAMARIVLVTGGCRSGKSAYAQQLAESLPPTRLFVATCPVTDDEMRAPHRAAPPGAARPRLGDRRRTVRPGRRLPPPWAA